MPTRSNPTHPHSCDSVAAAVCALALALSLPLAETGAQVDPSQKWRTIRTGHFEVLFSTGLEEVARRAAGSAERAYDALSKDLHPPRGRVSIVVADNLDVSNGYATFFPSNRIVIFARPTVDANSLKFIDDWIDLVVVHELAHIFHLDRSRRLWRVGQALFGRNPFLFTGAYSPSWLAEGLAVHYESKITGAGRVYGTDFGAVARAHELGGNPPARNELSAASPIYPLGNMAYTYGTPLIGKAASNAGPNALRDYVDVTAGRTIPFLLNTNARRAFGIDFDSAFALWSDSVQREAQRVAQNVAPPPRAATGGWFAVRPRWVDDSTLIWAGADPKSVPALRSVRASGGAVTILAERNTNDVNVPLAGGLRVFAQQEYADAYTQRTDLYAEHRGRTWRITNGARLTHPDARYCDANGAPLPAGAAAPSANTARPDLCIVAVQLQAGEARLVRVLAGERSATITPITEASSAVLYSEPRWSRDGTQIATTKWSRGGTSAIAILDLTGREMRTLGRTRAVNGGPSWGAGDSTIYFSSDRSGRSAIYRASLSTGGLVRIADSPTGLYEAEVSPDGTRVATMQLWSDGLNVTVLAANGRADAADSTSVLPAARGTPLARADAPSGAYSALRSALPTYWLPTVEPGDGNRYAYGLFTGGNDLVGRHAWSLRAAYEPDLAEPSWSANYSYAGLGRPVVHLGGEEVWDHFALTDSGGRNVGTLQRRKIFASTALTFSRPRIRQGMALSVGASLEWRDFATDPAPLFARLDPTLKKRYTYPSPFVSVAYSNARQPALALGPENGISFSATVRQRWRSDNGYGSNTASVIGSLAAYRGLDFGGRIHHLVAARVAAANASQNHASDFGAGGGSGGFVQLVPGLTVGEGRRTFFVRGFPSGAQYGSRALGGNVEYRLPLGLPAKGLGPTPLYFQRLSAAVFADGAAAWCPSGARGSPICPRATPREWMSSVGAELHLDAAVQYDSPYRLRVGVATPTSGKKYFGKSNVTGYITVGLPF